MSQENVQIVQAALEAWNRSDWDAILDAATPDFELDMSRAEGPFRGVYGARQVDRFWAEFAQSWESRRFEPHEFIDAGEDVVVPVTLQMRGRDGIEVSARITHVWTLHDGRLTRMCMYQTRAEALEAVGLSDGAMSQENVEIARSIYADPRGLTASDKVAPDAVFDFSEVYPDSPIVTGAEELRRFRDSGPWSGSPISFEPERFLQVDDGRVLVLVRVSATGRRSGAGVEVRAAHELTISDGVLVRFKAYENRAKALEAVGLSE